MSITIRNPILFAPKGELYPRKLIEEDLVRLNLPRAYWKLDASKITNDILLKYLKVIQERLPDRGLLLSGPNGIGKTAFVCMALQHARRYGHTGLFVEAIRLREFIFGQTPFDEEQSVQDRMLSVDMLAIDDLGKDVETSKDWQKQILDSILRQRAMNGKITLMTTNVSVDNLELVFHISTLHIIKQACTLIKMEGIDHRGNLKVIVSKPS